MKRKILLLGVAVILLLGLLAAPALAQVVDVEVGIYDNVFRLENKDISDWSVPVDEIGADFGYNNSGSTFDFGLKATGLPGDTSYSLIYYADTENRFTEWGGVVATGVGTVIATGTSGSDGTLELFGSPELGMNLPSLPDANAYCYDYALAPDFYDHATGAKVWLVPTDVLTGGNMPVATWSPDDSWLFETDLVNYSDTDEDPETMIAITVEPDSLDFGLLMPGQVASEDLTITNTGFVDVDISATATGVVSGMTMTLNTDAVGDWGTAIPYTTPDSFEVVTVGIVAAATPGNFTGTITFTAVKSP